MSNRNYEKDMQAMNDRIIRDESKITALAHDISYLRKMFSEMFEDVREEKAKWGPYAVGYISAMAGACLGCTTSEYDDCE